MTIHYTDADVTGLNEETLALRYWNGSGWVTDGITFIKRNTAQNYVVFTITHLSEFGLFGETAGGEYTIYLPLVLRSH